MWSKSRRGDWWGQRCSGGVALVVTSREPLITIVPTHLPALSESLHDGLTLKLAALKDACNVSTDDSACVNQ